MSSSTVAVVTNIPRPYRQALFRVIRTQLASRDLSLNVLYTSDPAKHTRRGPSALLVTDPAFEWQVPSWSARVSYERVLAIPRGLPAALRRRCPSCVVAGGFGIDAILSARWCRAHRIPLIVWTGAWPGREGSVGRVRSAVRRWLVRNACAFMAYGTAAGDYLASLGATQERIFYTWNTVDLETIAEAAAAAAVRRAELTDKYDLAAKNLLYVGTLAESKGLHELVSAALACDPPSSDWALNLVGDGPLSAKLKSKVREANKQSNFRFHGLRPGSDVAELLGVTDGFILPTKREAWGLVINEAMACGVPVIASPQAGATRDLIEDGLTGFVVDPADTDKLVVTMYRILSDDPDCARIGQAGAKAVREKASLDRAADGFVSAVLHALEGRDCD